MTTSHPQRKWRGLLLPWSSLRLLLILVVSLAVVRAVSQHYGEALLTRTPLPGNTFALVQKTWIEPAPAPRYFASYVAHPIHNTTTGTLEVTRTEYGELTPGQQVCVRQGQLAEHVRDCYRP